MRIDFFVEEPSMEIALEYLFPKILGEAVPHHIFRFNGKAALLKHLPNRLLAYKHWVQPENSLRIVVLVDRDNEDCRALKNKLDVIAREAGLIPKSDVRSGIQFHVLNRVVIEELESWFLGDNEALCAAYPKVPKTLCQQAAFRNPDAVAGGTWEALERVLKRAGYHRGGLEKLRAARDISQHMEPARNRSQSFQTFYKALKEIVG